MRAKLFIGAMAVAGLATLGSGLKVKLPGSNNNMSVNLPFILIAVAVLSHGEALVIAAVSAFTQCLPSKGKSFKPEQVLFNVCTLLGAVTAAAFAYHRAALDPRTPEWRRSRC